MRSGCRGMRSGNAGACRMSCSIAYRRDTEYRLASRPESVATTAIATVMPTPHAPNSGSAAWASA